MPSAIVQSAPPSARADKESPPPSRPVLVLRPARFGDIALSLAAMQAIRAHHPNARLVCLTTASQKSFLHQSGIFEACAIDAAMRFTADGKPKFFDLAGRFLSVIYRLRRQNFSHLYRLQSNHRTRDYLWAYELIRKLTPWFGPKPKIIYAGAPHADAPLAFGARMLWHLEAAGLHPQAKPDLSAFGESMPPAVEAAAGHEGFALLIPGASGRKSGTSIERDGSRRGKWPPRATKCWPARHFADIAQRLEARGILPVVLGTRIDAEIAAVVATSATSTINLLDQTEPDAIIALARRARFVLSNDTGPAQLAALAGGRVLSLFGAYPNASRWAPPGAVVLEHEPLAELEPNVVWQEVEKMLSAAKRATGA